MPTETEMKDGSAKGGIENTSDPVRRTDERLRGELGSAAAKRARERFTSAKSAGRYARLYEQLVGGGAHEVVAEAVST